MSAYVVAKDHIDLLVSAAIAAGHGGGLAWYPVDNLRALGMEDTHALRREATRETADGIGALLIRENLASVCYRYGLTPDGDLPGPVAPYWQTPYRWDPVPSSLYTPADVVKAVEGYEYQACEHDGWPASEARQFCDALLRRYAMTCAKESTAWEWTRPGGRS